MTDELPDHLHIRSALQVFALTVQTQGQEHIKPLHKYFSMRLVLEGGFLPDEVTPHPPFAYRYQRSGMRHILSLDKDAETRSEQTIIGGLKAKSVDVVVSKPSIGPIIAISLKGTGNAFRNLTNRMEEAVGDCTNLHLRYPGLVYGFFHLIKANRPGQPGVTPRDVSVLEDESIAPVVQRYITTLEGLAGRKLWREDPSAYEAVALIMVESTEDRAGEIFIGIPTESSLYAARFINTLLTTYDIRYPYVAVSVREAKRVEWDPDSPLFELIREHADKAMEDVLGYQPRLSP